MKIMEVNGCKTWVVLARHRSFKCKPERDGIIRVDDFKQACIMQSNGKVGSKGQWGSMKQDTSQYRRLFKAPNSLPYKGRLYLRNCPVY